MWSEKASDCWTAECSLRATSLRTEHYCSYALPWWELTLQRSQPQSSVSPPGRSNQMRTINPNTWHCTTGPAKKMSPVFDKQPRLRTVSDIRHCFFTSPESKRGICGYGVCVHWTIIIIQCISWFDSDVFVLALSLKPSKGTRFEQSAVSSSNWKCPHSALGLNYKIQ